MKKITYMTLAEKEIENKAKERDSIVSAIRALTDVMESKVPDDEKTFTPGTEQKYVPCITGDNRDKVGSKLMELIATL